MNGVPRFNMPFELGLAVAQARRGAHSWWVMESQAYRLQQSLSDLNGTDPYIHGGQPARVLQTIDNIFDRPNQAEVQLPTILALLQEHAPQVRERYGSLYASGAFRTLVYAATRLTARLRESAT